MTPNKETVPVKPKVRYGIWRREVFIQWAASAEDATYTAIRLTQLTPTEELLRVGGHHAYLVNSDGRKSSS